MKKVKVRDCEYLDLSSYFCGISVDEVCKRLKEKEQILSDLGFENIVVDVEYYYEDTQLKMVYDRPETTAELKKRMRALEKEKEITKKKLENDRKLYEQLKKKFERDL